MSFLLTKSGGAPLVTGGALSRNILIGAEIVVAPTADNTGGFIDIGATESFDVLAGALGTRPLVLSDVVITSGGGVAGVLDGKLQVTAPSTPGTMTITYKVSNSAGESNGTLGLVVQDVLLPPTANDDFGQAVENGPTIDFNVLFNDLGTAPLAIDSISPDSGPGTVALIGNLIRFTPGAAGTKTVDYTVSNGVGSDGGRLTITISPASIPPVLAQSGGFSSTANLTNFTLASNLATPADTKGVLVFVYTYLDFSAGSDPSNVTSVSLNYGGTAMNRVDGSGNVLNRGGAPTIFAFLLNSPADTIPTGGNLDWSINIDDGSTQVTGASYHFIEDVNDDVVFSVLNEVRGSGTGGSIDSPFTADDASLIINASAINGLGAFTGDGADWTEEQRQELVGSNAALSGALITESRTFTTGAADTHTLSTNAADFRSTITVQFKGQGAPTPQPATAVDDTGDATTNGPSVLFDVAANDTGDAPLIVQNPVIVSGGGVATISANKILFNPPGTAGVTEIDYDVVNGIGGDTGRLTVTTSDPAPPVAVDDVFATTASGVPVLFDVLANDTGSGPLALDSVTPLSATGSAAVVAGQVEYTPPSGSGTDTFQVTISNSVTTDTSILTLNYSDVTLGPRTGFGVGIGQTSTSLTNIGNEVETGRAAQEAFIRQKHDARLLLGDAAIRAANPGFVDLTGGSLGDLNNALNAGNRRLFLRGNVNYNWSGSKPNFDNIELVGLVDNGMPEVTIGGTPKNRGQIQFRIRGQGGRVEGIKFKDGALCFSFVGASGTIPRFHMDFCKFENTANSIHHEFSGAFGNPNFGARCTSIRWNNCLAENVSHGLNMRCGPGYGETGSPPSFNDFAVGSFEAKCSMVKNADNMGICVHYDTRGGTSQNVFWPIPGSTGVIEDCLVDRRNVASTPGFPANLTALEDFTYRRTFFTNTLANPFGRDDDVYTKCRTGRIEDCVIWNTGASNNFQGVIGAKGEGNPGTLPLGVVTVRNNFVGHDNSIGVSRVVFTQRSNLQLIENVMIIADGSIGQGGGITQQGGGTGYSGFVSRRNLYRAFGGFNQSVVAQLSSNIQNWLFEDDVVESRINSTHTLIQLRNGGGHTHSGSTIRGVTFKRFGSGNTTAISIQQSGSTLSNPTVEDNFFDNINTALNVAFGSITGVVRFTGNSHNTGATTPGTSNGAGANVQTFGAGGNNTF